MAWRFLRNANSVGLTLAEKNERHQALRLTFSYRHACKIPFGLLEAGKICQLSVIRHFHDSHHADQGIRVSLELSLQLAAQLFGIEAALSTMRPQGGSGLFDQTTKVMNRP